MKFLIRKAAGRYRNWMYGWENGLANRSTDRIVRPFDFGLEWSANWPCSGDISPDGADSVEYIEQLNVRAIARSDEFFGYRPPTDFRLQKVRDGEWLRFTSPVVTPYAENNTVPRTGDHWRGVFSFHKRLTFGTCGLGDNSISRDA